MLDNKGLTQKTYQGYYAGFVSRAVAFLVDIALLAVTIVVLLAVEGLTINFFIEKVWSVLGVSLPKEISILLGIATVALLFAFHVTIVLGYYIFMWMLLGQTLGKLLMGVRIVRTDGKRMSFWRSVVRMVGTIMSLATLTLGVLWILIDDRRQSWGDKLAGTYVIYAWEAREDDYIKYGILYTMEHAKNNLANVLLPWRWGRRRKG